jgi:hypothetical protein
MMLNEEKSRINCEAVQSARVLVNYRLHEIQNPSRTVRRLLVTALIAQVKAKFNRDRPLLTLLGLTQERNADFGSSVRIAGR